MRYLEDGPAERKRTGVEKPLVDATFQRGTTETVRVRLAAGKAETDPVYALREDQYGSALAEVPRSALAALDKSPAELRDRTVLHAKPEDVISIRIGSGDGALVLERERPADGGPETWRLRSPTQGLADNFKAASLLYGLTSLASRRRRTGSPRTRGPPGSGPRHGPSCSRVRAGRRSAASPSVGPRRSRPGPSSATTAAGWSSSTAHDSKNSRRSPPTSPRPRRLRPLRRAPTPAADAQSSP